MYILLLLNKKSMNTVFVKTKDKSIYKLIGSPANL